MRFQTEMKGVKLQIQIDLQVPDQVYSDEKRFRQVLFNLIGNAVKFTFNGSITIDVTIEGGLLKV